jgi:hypothetical protein
MRAPVGCPGAQARTGDSRFAANPYMGTNLFSNFQL